LGNFFTVRDISKKYDLQVLRLFMLSAHYRSPLNFSDDLMESAKVSLERIRTAAEHLKDVSEHGKDGDPTEAEQKIIQEAQSYVGKFDERMDDDCNTADALSVVFELVRFANTNITEESTKAAAKAVLDVLTELTDVLGLILFPKKETLDSDIEALIEERQAARKAKNFKRADEIRDQLLKEGIQLLDTREGVKWKRV
jgi:cysteinyl-tRNA synthetase